MTIRAYKNVYPVAKQTSQNVKKSNTAVKVQHPNTLETFASARDKLMTL